jgi:GNAT superfamily N-acetyltransferase
MGRPKGEGGAAETSSHLVVRPVTPGRWEDLVQLFGWDRGGYSGCWCMWFRITQQEFSKGAPRGGAGGNRAAMKRLVERGTVPGLLAYREGRPVGWVSVAPREQFGRVERSPVTKEVDDQPGVWSVVCWYIDRHHRGQGVGYALLHAAVDHAARRGAGIVEGYPVDPSHRTHTNAEAFVGVESMFRQAGFKEVARRSPGRPVMRYTVKR